MSQMIDFTLPSCQPGRTLHAFRCVPEGEVRAVLQLSHGMVEFIDRYKPLAEYLAANEMVRNVRYPGLSSHPDHAVATGILEHGFGPAVEFDLIERSAGDFFDALPGEFRPSAPKRIMATSANPTATAPCWRICTL